MIINAKNELLEHANNLKIEMAKIRFGDDYGFEDDEKKVYVLKKGYSEKEYLEFLENINIEYDCGYGGQNLFGIIWYEDGTWSERGEYDGSEWWQRHVRPNFETEAF